jgi:hypothetical protein
MYSHARNHSRKLGHSVFFNEGEEGEDLIAITNTAEKADFIAKAANYHLLWEPRANTPPEGKRILVFSPAYPEGDPMRVRIIDSQFLATMTDATHWAIVHEPK